MQENTTNLKQSALQGAKWNAINSFGNRIVSFVLGIILARLLSPEDYGIVGMTSIFFALAGIMIDGGICVALIRKKDTTLEDSSTIFFFNISVSIFLFVIICVCSGTIAEFLNAPVLTDIVKVSALTMVIGSFGSVQWALMSKNVNFKTPALIHLPVNLISGGTGVLFAYLGFGPWTIVFQSLLSTLLSTITIWYISSWRPILCFSIKSFKELYAFSGNIAINSVLDTLYNDGLSLFIGKFYSPSQLGYYSKGQSTAQLPSSFLYYSVSGVILPILSKVQDNDDLLYSVYRKFMRMISLIIFFSMFLLILIAEPLTLILYTEKWQPAIVFIQIFSLRYMLYHISAINWNLLLVKGRSDWALKKETINKIINFTCVIIAIPFGPISIAWASLIGCIGNIIVNIWVAKYLFDFGFKKQCKDFLPYLMFSMIACLLAFLITRIIEISALSNILISILLSTSVYLGILYLLKDQTLIEIVRITPLRAYLKK